MANGDNVGQDYNFLGELYEVSCQQLARPLTTPDGSTSVSPWHIRSTYDELLWKLYTSSAECNPSAPFNECCPPEIECNEVCNG